MNYLDMESKKVSSWGSTYRNFDLIVRKQIKARSKAKYLIENAKIKKETVGISGTTGTGTSGGTSGSGYYGSDAAVSGTLDPIGTHCATGSYNVAIGYQALSRCNNIGIGTTSPKVKLDMEK